MTTLCTETSTMSPKVSAVTFQTKGRIASRRSRSISRRRKMNSAKPNTATEVMLTSESEPLSR